MVNGQIRWTITGQQETMQIDPITRQFVEGVKVTFSTPLGDSGSVFISKRDYKLEKVNTAIAEQVATMNAVRDSGQ